MATNQFLFSSVFGLVMLFSSYISMSIVTEPTAMVTEDVTTESDAQEKALQHMQEMDERTCSTPVPKMFPVKDIYPSASKRYRPHCVLLHRCDDDAGCCQNDRTHCSPNTTETVQLYFRVRDLAESGRGKVMKMPFINHTSCQCLQTVPR